MNLEDIEQLRGPLQELIDSGSRTNPNKLDRYWYPLSMATYDVEEVLAAVDSLCSFRTTMWEKTLEFERQFAALQGSRSATMVNSGSSADLLIAFALVNPSMAALARGDEVLMPAVTWPTQVWSAMMAGLSVRLVDANPRTLNVDVATLEAAITPRTRALSLVHLMGNPCNMDQISDFCRRHELVLFEDCCEALGASYSGTPVGSFGVASSYSFFFSHHITTMEGGMICCDSESNADLFRLLRAHGWSRNTRHMATDVIPGVDPRYTFLNWGFNVRPTELQASFGLVQLGRLELFQVHRRHNATRLCKEFATYGDVLRVMETEPSGECSWFALPIVVDPGAPFTRDELAAGFEQSGIETRPIVAGSLARHPVAAMFPELNGYDLPGADAVHERGLYIGVHPVAEDDCLDRLAAVLDTFVREKT